MTNVNPMLRVNHNGDYATGFLDAEGFIETYVNNPDLNYLGANGTLILNLDNALKRLLPNASVLIADAVSYAPTPPGFVNPAAGTSPGAPSNIQDVFAQGILFSRTNRVTNSGILSMTYATSPTTGLSASYRNAILRFPESPSTPQGGTPVSLFDTTTHTGRIGGNAQLSGVDTLNVNYSHTQSEFTDGSTSSFSVNNDVATIGWSRNFSPNVSASVGGGGIFLDPGGTTYAANAALVLNFTNTRATLSYERLPFPSFAGVPTNVIADVILLSAVQQIGLHWQLTGVANYSHGSGESGIDSIRYDSYSGAVDLVYLITRVWSMALGYSYMKFDQEFAATKIQFDRHAATLSLRASWE
ncbi:MAG: hypothetical protein ACT4O4_00830 [Nitrospiraceae bacterium]